ncbi:MAG: hypothetical protein KME15_07080 [Drouetiella hepatica Uher 2000/2452]|uniref:Uncharacterized protein n=1 Tax=Drouetiella hepatica Uher 2000/2452 TaxID=904376 RepID=A0A951QAT1_9CYAN|nr:hypothetical protein [Drouetiella hepatica Uher 2000/2452]
MNTSNPSERTIKLPSDVSEELLLAICESVDIIACECPGYLASLLRQVHNFRSYTKSCIEQFPEDAETHDWLSDRAQQVEKILYQTVLELMHKENLITDDNELSLDRLSERALSIALRQID